MMLRRTTRCRTSGRHAGASRHFRRQSVIEDRVNDASHPRYPDTGAWTARQTMLDRNRLPLRRRRYGPERHTEGLSDIGAAAFIGSVGTSFDCLAETDSELGKTELNPRPVTLSTKGAGEEPHKPRGQALCLNLENLEGENLTDPLLATLPPVTATRAT